MSHDRQIDERVDRRFRARRGWGSSKAVQAKTKKRSAWRRIVAWIVVAALLGKLFQIFAIEFEDNYIAFVLTVLPLVSATALPRPASDRRHVPMVSRYRSRR